MLAADFIRTWNLISLTSESLRSSQTCLNLIHFTVLLCFCLLFPLYAIERMHYRMLLCSSFVCLGLSSNFSIIYSLYKNHICATSYSNNIERWKGKHYKSLIISSLKKDHKSHLDVTLSRFFFASPSLFIYSLFVSPTYLKCLLHSKFQNIHRHVSRLISSDLFRIDSEFGGFFTSFTMWFKMEGVHWIGREPIHLLWELSVLLLLDQLLSWPRNLGLCARFCLNKELRGKNKIKENFTFSVSFFCQDMRCCYCAFVAVNLMWLHWYDCCEVRMLFYGLKSNCCTYDSYVSAVWNGCPHLIPEPPWDTTDLFLMWPVDVWLHPRKRTGFFLSRSVFIPCCSYHPLVL